jgi:hypothetical protein
MEGEPLMMRLVARGSVARGSVAIALAWAALAPACGGATGTLDGHGGPAEVSGTIAESPVATTDQVGAMGTGTIGGEPVAAVAVIITNLSGTCAILQRDNASLATQRNAQALVLAAYADGGSVSPGTYTIGPQTPPAATAVFEAQNASCVSRGARVFRR